MNTNVSSTSNIRPEDECFIGIPELAAELRAAGHVVTREIEYGPYFLDSSALQKAIKAFHQRKKQQQQANRSDRNDRGSDRALITVRAPRLLKELRASGIKPVSEDGDCTFVRTPAVEEIFQEYLDNRQRWDTNRKR